MWKFLLFCRKSVSALCISSTRRQINFLFHKNRHKIHKRLKKVLPCDRADKTVIKNILQHCYTNESGIRLGFLFVTNFLFDRLPFFRLVSQAPTEESAVTFCESDSEGTAATFLVLTAADIILIRQLFCENHHFIALTAHLVNTYSTFIMRAPSFTAISLFCTFLAASCATFSYPLDYHNSFRHLCASSFSAEALCWALVLHGRH